ncbi:MAG: NADPH-dependent FMN reductase [Candidatus Magasanikbacteria bacterium CG11_big_fil_rev_8_21_14_0_20_39_34]|uniref:NADPH-dependent FMN reductase n=1 Tax=Candidatus Magasanikbacteria bacterium CG11_big_fil_rev_8_21_14_0_20_39_34 TaxID=1974653 RepID=A0A2H0N5V7_9BACT|nr:MAG: NADPH-dependent FMN reductase [Candidatus Magasanikbacteria bacterium CG11_big_fil_rev_8_21_14_0_20_39_34]
MKKFFIPVVLGTARKGSQSTKVAKYVTSELKKDTQVQTKLLKVEKFLLGKTVPVWQDKKAAEPWLAEVRKADAFVFVVPEYNHGYPGELKMVLDQGVEDYYNKPCIVAGVSAGQFGGTRVIENLLPVLYELGMIMSGTLNFGNVEELFEKDGSIMDPKRWEKRVQRQMTTLKRLAEALGPLQGQE